MAGDTRMKRFLSIIAILGVACLASAEDRDWTKKVTGGLLAVTNNSSATYEIKTLTFDLPTASITNTFTLSLVRPVLVPGTNVTTVSTVTELVGSDLVDVVKTNTYISGDTVVYNTNDLLKVTQVNSGGSYVYSQNAGIETNRIPCFEVRRNDIIRYSFSETAAFYLTQDAK
jgi:hypothetical protein